jgi:hypothetical protein
LRPSTTKQIVRFPSALARSEDESCEWLWLTNPIVLSGLWTLLQPELRSRSSPPRGMGRGTRRHGPDLCFCSARRRCDYVRTRLAVWALPCPCERAVWRKSPGLACGCISCLGGALSATFVLSPPRSSARPQWLETSTGSCSDYVLVRPGPNFDWFMVGLAAAQPTPAAPEPTPAGDDKHEDNPGRQFSP